MFDAAQTLTLGDDTKHRIPAVYNRAFVSPTPEEFLTALSKSPRVQAFTPHRPSDFAGYQLFMNLEGTIGGAVSPEGDIQNVFNNSGIPGAGGSAIEEAIEEAIRRGGRTLDVYGDKLASIYAKHGFVEIERVKFDPALKTPAWDIERDGTPDVIFMKLSRRNVPA